MKYAPATINAALRRLRRHALWLLVAFFLAISCFALRNVQEKIDDHDNAHTILAWTQVSLTFSRMVHELQKERGMSSGFISSRGNRFGRDLTMQREETDRALQAMRNVVATPGPEIHRLIGLASTTLTQIDGPYGLSDLRTAIDGIRISRDVAVERYSTLIAAMFDHLLTTMSVGRTGWIVRRQMAFVFFLQAKEMAGQERALLTAMLSAGNFGPMRMAAFHRIKAVETAAIDKFRLLADADAVADYTRSLEQPFVAEAERIRRRIVAVGASGEAPHTRMPEAGVWFDLATQKIDTLSRLERGLSDKLLDSAHRLNGEAEMALAINGTVIVLSLGLAGLLTVLTVRGNRLATSGLHLAAEVFEHSAESIIITDADTNIIAINPAFTRISGYEATDAIGRNPRLLKSGRHEPAFYAAMWERLLRTGSWEGEIWNRHKKGAIYPALLSIAAVKDARFATTHYIAMMADLSKFKETESLVEQLRTFDPLTGLPNRNAWHSAIDQAVAIGRRNRKGFAVIDLCIDRFKLVNDSLGHQTGDAVLVAVAERMKRLTQYHDVAARPGGDHFAVLLRDTDVPQRIGEFCECILNCCTEPIVVGDQQLNITTSIGIAIYPTDGDDTGTLLRNAELALASAKERGGASYAFHSEAMNAAGAKLLALEQMMRHAIAQGEFVVAYQPQVDANDGRLVGVEALIRWNNADLGPVSPAQFIPVAETTGLIVPIGEWVLRQACRDAQSWRQEFGIDIPVAVNLSARQFQHADLLSTVQTVLDETGLPFHLLELEITEGALMDDPAGATAILDGLRWMGVRTALDDFGTGYSSLAYLRTFPLDRLKIDRAFVIGLAEHRHDQAIANTIVSLGHQLGMQVLAEGVETEAQSDFLRANGCDVFQGYLYGKPMPATAIAENLRNGVLRS